MVIFNSYVKLPEGTVTHFRHDFPIEIATATTGGLSNRGLKVSLEQYAAVEGPEGLLGSPVVRKKHRNIYPLVNKHRP